ncbi:hypothetical protein I3843_06G115900 [Carya illinoinensis]|nr:hypothetical protein I3843_06G115900 [Carya illinoinensis]
MSRCMPFPPPGYLWNGVEGEALTELIKLNRERVEAEKERKEEKRRREKERKKRREDDEIIEEMQSRKSRHKDGRNKRSREKSDNQRKRKHENSSHTEELKQPMISYRSYDSSDNSQNRVREKNRWSANGYPNHGFIVHFDFQWQKHKDRAAQSIKPFCADPTWMDILVQEEFEMDFRTRKDQLCSTSRMPTAFAQKMASSAIRDRCQPPPQMEVVTDHEEAETAPASSSSESALQVESQYRALIVNWVPPPLQTDHHKFDDQEWLFQRTQPRSDMT